ncbi:MAG: hypothetical protein NTV32_01440 [Gammaproteobacteria bacterium]|nr:hypothetical protein [Gammaproteobacteria bacterium]
MVFVGHFLILLLFMLALYLLANYTSLRTEAKELAALQESLKTLTEGKERAYYLALYNENREAYNRRKHSVFSIVLIFFFKNLDQSFSRIN